MEIEGSQDYLEIIIASDGNESFCYHLIFILVHPRRFLHINLIKVVRVKPLINLDHITNQRSLTMFTVQSPAVDS